MNRNKLTFDTIHLFILIAALLLPLSANSQCMTTSINGPSTIGSPVYIYIGKGLSNASQCTLTGHNNVRACFPGGSPPVNGAMASSSFVNATAYTTVTGAVCSWTCNCGQVKISSADDGLPVELMEFTVDDKTPGK